jgi:hypothetical protein
MASRTPRRAVVADRGYRGRRWRESPWRRLRPTSANPGTDIMTSVSIMLHADLSPYYRYERGQKWVSQEWGFLGYRPSSPPPGPFFQGLAPTARGRTYLPERFVLIRRSVAFVLRALPIFLVKPPSGQVWDVSITFGPTPGDPLAPPDFNPRITLRTPWRLFFDVPLTQDGVFLRGQAPGFLAPGSATYVVVLIGDVSQAPN